MSKEYVDINFKFNYDGTDENPVKFDLSVPENEKQQTAASNNERKNSVGSKIDIYDINTMVYIEPMFIIDTKKF